jgi:curved DNA-binding protein CbpA
MARMTETNPIDLYDILGVERGATLAEIRAAYRKSAMNKHPDQGGTAEEFAAIKRAHDVLSSETARKIYDETGKIDDLVSSRPRKVVATVSAILKDMLAAMTQGGVAVKRQNMTQLIVANIHARRKATVEAIDRAEKLHANLVQVQDRFKRKKGANVLGDIARGQTAQTEARIAAMKNELQVFDDALLLVRDHTFEAELAIDADYLQQSAVQFTFDVKN